MNTGKHGFRSGFRRSVANSVRKCSKGKVLQISVSICVHLWLIPLCLFTFSSDAAAQVRPVYDQGALGLGQILKRLNTSASTLMIGAHPDDEDTALLAYLARGENARTAYLSLTRGDGGQNIIGPELGESLGVIRTEELLQARKLDGAEQYFTRAYDYGFSKTLDEAKQKWDEKVILCDVVRVIRNFRPLVVISQFSGTPTDGHGQHQFSGYISPLAAKAAADEGQCARSGPVWTVRKFYVRHGFRATSEPRLRINTGKYDPLLGRSYFEIAMEARSQHKSQEQGVLELKGDQFSGLNLVGSDAKESGVFDGLDVSIKGAAKNTGNSEGSFAEKLTRLQEIAEKALTEYDVRAPEQMLGTLVDGYKLAHNAESSARNPASKAFVQRKKAEFLEAIRLAAGIRIDVLADRETVLPGEKFTAAANIFFPPSTNVKVKDVVLKAPRTWTISPAQPPSTPATGFFRRETAQLTAHFDVRVAADQKLTQPYWLEEPRDGDMFRWRSDDNQTLPFQSPVAVAEIRTDIHGTEVDFFQPIEYRFADDIRGEIRRNLSIVPLISVGLDEALIIAQARSKQQPRRIVMSVTSNSDAPVSGTASLHFDRANEWSNTEPATAFNLAKKGEKAAIIFDVVIPPETKPGKYVIRGEAKVGGTPASDSARLLAYDHIQTQRTYSKAAVDVRVLEFGVSPVRVGYIVGSGDAVPEAIRQMGLDLALLDEKTLSAGDLSKFDVLVVGIRASEVRPDFASNSPRLLDWVRNGGTLIVQYQRPTYAQQGLLPYPAQLGPRVADENAPVKILQPDHSIFNFPNKITAEDFQGWVQERNLYNFSTMDEKYVGLLESHDPGEAENKGGLVVADVGKGKYIYCSYSLFRQLPAGVPGAYRLFANMLSLSRQKPKR